MESNLKSQRSLTLKNFQCLYEEICAMYSRIPERQYMLLYSYYNELNPTDKAMARAVMANGHFVRMRKALDEVRRRSM